MANFNILESLDNQIQRNDEELLILLKRRMQSEKKVVEYFLKNPDEENHFKERETKQFDFILQKSRDMGFRHLFIQDVFDLILKEAEVIRKEHLENKTKKK